MPKKDFLGTYDGLPSSRPRRLWSPGDADPEGEVRPHEGVDLLAEGVAMMEAATMGMAMPLTMEVEMAASVAMVTGLIGSLAAR
ncbi:unnamed protein product [Urochloa humidicola]